MRNSNNQQYDYQKVHQVTPEELQKTLVLNLADFEETARIEKMTSKKPALIVALLGVFSIALGFSFPLVQSFTARDKTEDTIVENREEYETDEEDVVLSTEEIVTCTFDKIVGDGTHVVSIADISFNNGVISSFVRTTTVNPIPGDRMGPNTVLTYNAMIQPLLVQMDGYGVTIEPTVEGGTKITTTADYSKLDFTVFPQKNQTHFTTSVDYASNTPKEQVLPDMATRGYVCE